MNWNRKIKRLKFFSEGLLLILVAFYSIYSFTAHATDAEKRTRYCNNTGRENIEGNEQDLLERLEKSCKDLVLAINFTTQCDDAIDQCIQRSEILFWDLLGENRDNDECPIVRFKHYYRCTACTYDRIVEDLSNDLKMREKSGVEESCHCGNGHLDPGELCDPTLSAPENSSLRCTDQCGWIVVDPVHPNPTGLQGDPPSQDPLTVTPGSPQQENQEDLGFGKLGLAPASSTEGCSLTFSENNPAALFSMILLFPLIFFGSIRKGKKFIP